VRWTAEQSTPCLRCIFPDAPPPGTAPTCDTAGVLGAVVLMVAAQQTAQAIKLLAGRIDALDRALLSLDLWANQMQRFQVGDGRRPDCPCCGMGQLVHLEGDAARSAITLCGRNAVQIAATEGSRVDLAALAARLAPHGRFRCSDLVLHGTFARERSPQGEPVQITLFPDGRAILIGTTEPESARAIYARYVGT
jgi:adenylyltransferase/sulfurtransferase